MQDFIESPRFDTEISYGSSGGPGFRNYVFTGESGRENTTVSWDVARSRYSVTQSIRDGVDMDVIRAMFYACRGRAVGFRYKDWGDFEITDSLIAVGDGATLIFKMYKVYGAGTTHEYKRRIFKPVSGTTTVKWDGVVVNPTWYSVNTTTGVITFSGIHIPPLDTAITMSGEYDVPVRFDMDDVTATHDEFDLQSWGSISLIEIKLED